MNWFVLLSVLCVCAVESYKILLLFPLPSRSLNILGHGVARHLIDAGHEVTYITCFPLKNPPEKLRQIDIRANEEVYKASDLLNISQIMKNSVAMNDHNDMNELAIALIQKTFENKGVQKLLRDPREHFDAIIAELFETHVYAGLAALYNCPMIWSYSMGVHSQVLEIINEPTNPAYVPDYLSTHAPPLTFRQRIEELATQLRITFRNKYIWRPKYAAIYKEIFGPLAAIHKIALPNYEDLIYNASLVLSNEHSAVSRQPSTPLNFKFVGGYHIEMPTKPLPQDLQNLMDNAKNGVIYFSMGSTWKSKDIPKWVIEDLLKMFSELKQTVLWKFEEDLPNRASNVHIKTWAPQQSILAHPNCKLFITHGGLLSSTEALHFGVPTIGVPIFFDQFLNTNKAVNNGYALRVDLNYDLAKNLKIAIGNMLSNSKYRVRVKELSQIYHDRVVPPGHELTHWVEHVIRTKGAFHLRSPAFMIPWYQKNYFDLLGLILVILVAITLLIKTTVRLLTGKKCDKDAKKKNN